jgi:hypothetical protein
MKVQENLSKNVKFSWFPEGLEPGLQKILLPHPSEIAGFPELSITACAIPILRI